MAIKKLDEYQLIQRGNIFKHCFLTAIMLLFVNITLLELDIEIMSHRNMMLFIIQCTVSLFLIEMILRDIYPIGEHRMRVLIFLYGFLGVAFAGISLYEAVVQKEALVENGIVSSTGLGFIMCVLALSILGVYLGRKLYNRKQEGES